MQGIPAFDWVSAILAVRVHAVTSWVNATNMSLSDDDPSIVFTDVTMSAGNAIVTFASSPTAQRLHVSPYTAVRWHPLVLVR